MKGIILLIVILLLIFIPSVFLKKERDVNLEKFLNYTKCNKYKVSKRLTKIFDKYDFNRKDNDWQLYLPCDYTNVESELRNMKEPADNKSIFGIDGCDFIASKYYLWKLMKKKYGDNYTDYMPKTYSNNKEEIKKIRDEYVSGNKYIGKKDIQAQLGLFIVNNLDELDNILEDRKFVIIQNLLNNPFLIEGRKINIRIYFLIVCQKNNIQAYMHSNGFIYYTPNKFSYESSDKHCHITSGYASREIYKTCPLTLHDLMKYLTKNGYNSSKFFNNIKNLIAKILDAIEEPICNLEKIKNNHKFQLFGMDVAPDNNLNVKVMEINKGPDLSAKDDRDDKVKNKVSEDVFRTVGLINDNEMSEFIKI